MEPRKIYERLKVLLNVTNLKPNDHPLHVFITRKHASKLKISETETLFYLSMWTNTKLRTTSTKPLPPKPGQGSIFHRMLSNSQNFPEILIPDNDEQEEDRRDSFASGMDVEVFLYVWVRDEQTGTDLGEHPCLTCSSQFYEHYNLDSNIIYVRQVIIYPVSNIVLGVSSREAFQWFTTKNFCDRLLKEVQTNPVLVRAKDVFLATYGNFLEDDSFKRSYYFDIFVLECSPVQQGLLSAKTEMVLTYMGDLEKEKRNFETKMESIIVSNPKGQQGHIGGLLKDIYISDFTRAMNQNLKSPGLDDADSYNPPSFKVKAKAIKAKRKQRIETIGKFKYEVVAQQPLLRRMLWREEKKQNFDPMYYVGMSRKLMIREGLFDSSYVLISPEYIELYEEEDGEQHFMERVCMVRCLGKEYDRSKKLFISPLCLFNMVKKPPIELPDFLILKRCDISDFDRSKGQSTSSQSWNTHLSVAKEVHISIVPSPNYSPRAPHDEALKQYCTIPRVVALGDVLAIRSSDDPLFWQNTGDDTENRFPCIYFKVANIKGKEAPHGNYIMDKDSTTLIQMSTEHSYIPAMMQTFLNTTPQGFWDRDCLPGLNRYVEELESFIIPHLTTRHNSKSLNSVPPAILVCAPVGCGKTTLTLAVARRLGMHAFKINCHYMYSESSGATEAKMKNAFNAAALYSPCILLLQSVHAIGRDRDGNTEDPRVASSFLSNVMQLKEHIHEYPVIVVATTHSSKDLTQDMLECFLHQVNIEVPNEYERGDMIDALLQTTVFSGKISIPYIAQRTAGFVLGDLAALVAHAKREAFRRIIKICSKGGIRPSLQEEENLRAAGIVVQQTDFQTALDQLQAAHSDAIGAPKIPNVTWDDVGGLFDVKTEILDTIQVPLQFPELLAAGLRRSGVLLYGPPGTGKTLLAKAVATECSLNFLSVKGPELINMYVGQSEENVREVFKRARSATPCVIFFDELDSLAPNRGKSGDSGGVMDRVVSQLLSELDGLNKACDVFVIGATNRPDLLDPALLRPGRFDKLLYLGVNEDHLSQLKILEALTRKFNHAPGLDLMEVVKECPFNLTGADFYALASDAMLNAVKRKIADLESGKTDDQTIVVQKEDYIEAAESLTPSVTEGELKRYEQLKQQFTMTSSGVNTMLESE